MMRLVCCVLTLALALSAPSQAQEPITAASVKSWADPLFEKALAERRLSGAVVSVVKDGEIIFEEGYGYADWPTQKPIDPASTQFRIGSATKTFSAVAIETLIEDGEIDSLDDPANLYLKRDQLPSPNGRDITIRDLATHRGGFADRAFGIASNELYEPFLSAETIASHRTAIVRAPAGRSVYSNYSTAMLGVIAEDVTGMPIEEIFETRIFAPLSMTHTDLIYGGAPPAALATPYAFLPSGAAQPVSFRGIDPFFAPVGAIASTGRDMAKYMIALLQGARGEETPLGLSPVRFDELRRRAAGNHPSVMGFGTIFLVMDWAGEEGFGHGGDWPGFHSIMWLLPEENAGVFISLMAEWPDAAPFDPAPDAPAESAGVSTPLSNGGILVAFLQHFLGPDAPVKTEAAPIPERDLAGAYRHEYRAYGSIAEFLDVLSAGTAAIKVETSDDGLMINGRGPYRPVGGNVYWNADSEAPLDSGFTDTPVWAFSKDASTGEIYAVPRLAIDPFVKTGPLGNPAAFAAILPVMLIVFVTGFAALFWRKGRVALRSVARPAAIAGAVLVFTEAATLLLRWNGETVLGDFLMGRPARFAALALGANLMSLCALIYIAAFAMTAAQWAKAKGQGLFETIHLGLLALSGAAALVFFAVFHFLGWQAP